MPSTGCDAERRQPSQAMASGKQDGGLDRKARQRVRRHDLAKQAVEREGDAQARGSATAGRARRRQAREIPAAAIATAVHCSRFSRSLQHEPAEQHVGERVEIIAEARGEDVPARHRIDVEQPVDADQERGERRGCRASAAARSRGADLVPAARQRRSGARGTAATRARGGRRCRPRRRSASALK